MSRVKIVKVDVVKVCDDDGEEEVWISWWAEG